MVSIFAISCWVKQRKETKWESKGHKKNVILNNFETLFSKSYSSVELFFIKIQPNKDICAQGLSLLRTGEKNQYAKSVCMQRSQVLRRGRKEKKSNRLKNKMVPTAQRGCHGYK